MSEKAIRPNVTAAPVEMRCPVSGRLFGKVNQGTATAEGFSIEVACRDCRIRANAAGDRVALLLHLFDGAGQCVETVVIRGADTRR